MRTLNKNGVHLEQCGGCRGIFLDAGELEQIVAAEGSYYGHGAPPAYAPGGHAPRYGDSPKPFRHGHGDSPRPYGGHGGHGYSDSPRGYRGGHGYGDSPRAYGGHGHKRRKGFLENLFD
ncbi:zf-TFIIB domain-containing protein [Amycolatopsis albispora]|uniref:Transcriptional regulator n=1 Tax=Amycolatopsis albispora TaxID=1804986 RepID=A0A344LEY7_9PSEU|nr:zf-TFIIB domain-containing protein [Amycolatopsis albispora]AXB46611.1 transcriptional regulator [Amycolatopsis albispora]